MLPTLTEAVPGNLHSNTFPSGYELALRSETQSAAGNANTKEVLLGLIRAFPFFFWPRSTARDPKEPGFHTDHVAGGIWELVGGLSGWG